MIRTLLYSAVIFTTVCATAATPTVVDRNDRAPIPGASVFDASGKMIGMSDANGTLPDIPHTNYPITIRSLGYNDLTLDAPDDSVMLTERIYQLPEITVGAADRNVVRLICYVREYTTVTGDNESTTMFAEHIVDYFLPRKGAKKVKTQRHPRKLGWRAFCHTTDKNGLDSVSYPSSDTNMFTWLDLIELDDKPVIAPDRMKNGAVSDSIGGKSGLKTLYRQTDNSFTATYDALADKKGHTWSPMAFKLFGFTMDVNGMMLSQTFMRNKYGEYLPEDLTNASYTFNATGRGKWIRKAFNSDKPVDLKAYFEIYVVDREYLPADEAKELMKDDHLHMKVKRPTEAPALDAATRNLIDRVIEEHNKK